MPRKIFFYIRCQNFFPQETQLDKDPFRIPERILYMMDCLIALSYFFSVNLILPELLLDYLQISLPNVPNDTSALKLEIWIRSKKHHVL